MCPIHSKPDSSPLLTWRRFVVTMDTRNLHKIHNIKYLQWIPTRKTLYIRLSVWKTFSITGWSDYKSPWASWNVFLNTQTKTWTSFKKKHVLTMGICINHGLQSLHFLRTGSYLNERPTFLCKQYNFKLLKTLLPFGLLPWGWDLCTSRTERFQMIPNMYSVVWQLFTLNHWFLGEWSQHVERKNGGERCRLRRHWCETRI